MAKHNKFKVGDKVRRVGESSHLDMHDGMVYTIKGVSSGVLYLTEITGAWFPEYFELVEYPNPPHKHRDLIIAWANGADIEYRVHRRWNYDGNPTWSNSVEYRIKPHKKKSERQLKIEELEQELKELKDMED